MKRFLFFCAFVALWFAANAGNASAEMIFESGTLGPTGLTFDDFGGMPEPSGSFVSDFAFTGVRFELIKPAVTKQIGGHFVIDPGHDDSFFGVLVRLDNATDFPDSGDLLMPDVLGHTLLAFPNSSAEVFGDLALSLSPGWYALVFGSGLFGATGQGGAPANNPDIDSPSYIAHQDDPGWFEISPPNGPFQNFRFVVEGNVIAEPISLVALSLGVVLLWACQRSRA